MSKTTFDNYGQEVKVGDYIIRKHGGEAFLYVWRVYEITGKKVWVAAWSQQERIKQDERMNSYIQTIHNKDILQNWYQNRDPVSHYHKNSNTPTAILSIKHNRDLMSPKTFVKVGEDLVKAARDSGNLVD